MLADIDNGRIIHTLIENIKRPSHLAFNSDGDLLAVVLGNTIQMWDVNNYQLLSSMEMDMGYVTDIAFSPDGRLFAVADDKGTIRIWGIPKR